MIAVDTNVLVYAYRAEMDEHLAAREAMDGLTNASSPWAVPWPCVHEFLAVVTNRRVFTKPISAAGSVRILEALMSAPNLVLLGESRQHLQILTELVRSPTVVGSRIHDAKIAAICLGHGVDELWTADRDFSYFPQLRTRNPLV